MGFWIFMLAMDLILPLSMVFLGRYFVRHAPGNINMLFGYRTARSMKNQDTWQFAHRYFGKLWYKMGLWDSGRTRTRSVRWEASSVQSSFLRCFGQLYRPSAR